MNIDDKYNVSFRCFFPSDGETNATTHYNPSFALSDIPRWLDAYKFTHPNCTAISTKVWFNGSAQTNDED